MTFNCKFTLGPLDGYVDKFPGKTFKRRPEHFIRPLLSLWRGDFSGR